MEGEARVAPACTCWMGTHLFFLPPRKILILGALSLGMVILGFLTVDRLQELMERRTCCSLPSAMAAAAVHTRPTPTAAALPAVAPHSNKAANPLATSQCMVRAADAALRAA